MELRPSFDLGGSGSSPSARIPSDSSTCSAERTPGVEPLDEEREAQAVDEAEDEAERHVALGLWSDLGSADGGLNENGSRPLECLGRVQTPEILAELGVER